MSNESVEITFRLADAGNTWNPALFVIREKGYGVYRWPTTSEDDCDDLVAIKDGRAFFAQNPVSLLGLIAMWEQLGDEWRKQGYPDEDDRILQFTYRYDKFVELDDEAFSNLVTYLKPYLFGLHGVEIPIDITRERLAEVMEKIAEGYTNEE
jgi:hypothetical protein